MSLSFAGPGGTAEHRWIFYALLRDNVIHHLERGRSQPSFSAIYLIGAALGADVVRVPASVLRSEMERARSLLDLPIGELALSSRTRAALALAWPPDEPGETTLIDPRAASSLALPGGATRLGEVFGPLVDDLLRLTEAAGEGDTVEIRDG